MFSRLASFVILALPVLAVATPANVARNAAPTGAPTTACCSSTIPADSTAATSILNSIGVSLSDVTAAIGLDCSSINVVGVGSGSSCDSSPVSCSGGIINSIGISCIPIST
ncbi:hypothetical protein BDW22DRAFT_1427481 [Trametopsis cervina]|nr:hypothetical protein BDW22DRAFT_1427481 [Trametopsis cervina]